VNALAASRSLNSSATSLRTRISSSADVLDGIDPSPSTAIDSGTRAAQVCRNSLTSRVPSSVSWRGCLENGLSATSPPASSPKSSSSSALRLANCRRLN
jgi:hypothetical protein